jgi:hypothetical protein
MLPQTHPLSRALKYSQHFVVNRPWWQHLYDPLEDDNRFSSEALGKPFQVSCSRFVRKCGKGQDHARWHEIRLAVESAPCVQRCHLVVAEIEMGEGQCHLA